MRKFTLGNGLLACCLLAGVSAWGQQTQNQPGPGEDFLDVAIVDQTLKSNVVGGDTLWMPGGSIQVHSRFWHGLGVVADVAGLHAGSINHSGTGLDIVTATFGPRYTWSFRRHRYAVFGQALFGEANGFNSIFPSSKGAVDSASSAAFYLGGGINVHLNRHFSVRALEADWLRTQMPNTTTNVQNHMRLGVGLIYRIR